MAETVEQTRGFTHEEVLKRKQAGQGNELPDTSSRSLAQILAANVFTHFNAIVFSGFAILLFLGRWQDALFGLPALFNTIIGVVQEYKAKRTLDQLAVLNAPTARVLRNGKVEDIAPADLVLGDVLVLKTGDQVTADARVLEGMHSLGEKHTDLEASIDVDESLLTGESDPIRKTAGDELLSGSSVVSGRAEAEVIRVGAEAYAAKLTAEAKRFSLVHSELRSSIDRLLKWISFALPVLILIVANGQMQSHGGWAQAIENGQWKDALVGAIAAVIAMVPLGLVLITSIAFAVSGVTLARQKVLIQELAAVEGLARVDVLCLDKTGTITTGAMRFDRAHVLTEIPGWQRVLGHIGDDPEANITAACLAEPFGGKGLLPLKQEIPFNSKRKWSALSCKEETAQECAGTWIMGAPEILLTAAEPTTDSALTTEVSNFARQGSRVLMLAHTTEKITFVKDAGQKTDPEPILPQKITPVCLLLFHEDVRADAPETLEYFAKQGVGIRVISGDDPRTVAAVARQVGIDCKEGFDARTLPENLEDMAEVLEREHVFGRVTPQQKLDMVRALKLRGHTVAMTGDGVNDALAIKESDLGIAMDGAAQATKAVSRLVLLDGRFDRLPHVVAEGRKVTANIERVSKLFLTKTTYAFGIGVLFGLLSLSFPFLPRQLSITDGLTIGLPAFFLALVPNTRRYYPGFLRRSLAFAIPAGLTVTAGIFALHLIAPHLGTFSLTNMQSASTLVLAGIALWVLAILARPPRLFRVLIVVGMYVGLWAVFAIPLGRNFFQIDYLPTPLFVLVCAISLVGMVLIEVLRFLHERYVAVREHG